MYDCKLMEIRRAFFAGWMGCGALFFVVDGGWRMADAGRLGDGCRFAPGFVGGWLLGCRNSAKTTQISASQESAPLLQSRSQPAPVSPAVRFRAGGSGGGVGRLAEVGIDEGWRIEWIPGSWMSHQRCAGWLGGKAEFLVEAIVAVLDG